MKSKKGKKHKNESNDEQTKTIGNTQYLKIKKIMMFTDTYKLTWEELPCKG